jgi:putative phosphoribosyl transferase
MTTTQPSPTAQLQRELTVPAGRVRLAAELVEPDAPIGAVVFPHAGTSDLNARNLTVAEALGRAGLATLLVDLQTAEETVERTALFDVPLLASRIAAVTSWFRRQELGRLPVGYLAPGTSGPAALWASVRAELGVQAVVTLGGWPDLAWVRLPLVQAPTLMIVGGVDGHVLDLSRSALAELSSCEHELAVVPGATHLFEQVGALEQAAELASGWFVKHLT